MARDDRSGRSALGQAIAPALRRFRRDRRGVSAVEFGLVAVPFLGLLAAIFETGFVFFQGAALQGAVQTAARSILTGATQGASATVTNASQFNTTYVCPNLPSFIPCASLITDVRTASSFAVVDATNDFYKSATQFCPGAPGTITVVRIAFPMPVFIPILTGFGTVTASTAGLVNDVPNNSGWKHLLLATAVFQTEPYNQANYTALAGCS